MPLFDIANANAYMSDNEKFLLALGAACLPAGSVAVEIGAFLGGSAELMLRAAGERIELHSVDTEDRMPRELLARHANLHFHHMRGSAFAREAAGRAVDLLFIDGDHSFAGIREDVEAFWPILGDGAQILAHDVLSDKHLGVRTYVEALLAGGCLTRPVRADSLVGACVNKSAPLPDADACARVALRLLELGGDSRDWLAQRTDRNDFLAQALVTPPVDDPRAVLVGRGKRGDFVARFLGRDPAANIDSWDAADPDARYYLCTTFADKALTQLVRYARVSPRNIFDVSPAALCRWLRDDIRRNGGARLLRAYARPEERAVIERLLRLLSAGDAERLCETGMLHDFFVCFPAGFPPLEQQ